MATLDERMAGVIARLQERWGGRRQPKAFYLNPADWAQFMATEPPTGRFAWGNNPTIWADEPTFEGLPVRESTAGTSRLYDTTKQGRAF